MGLLEELNPAQREAVSTTEGPLLVLAGAGSGKTRVLTYRIAHLLEQGLARPDQVLAVTFTNKAAAEVRERVEKLCHTGRRFPWLGTFHAICVKLLRANHEVMGLVRDFTIYDTDDQMALIKDVMKSLEINPETFKPRAALSAISRAKNKLEGVEQFERTAVTEELKTIARIYRGYQRGLRENQALDFDDLLVRGVDLLKQHPDVLARYQEQFRYILVDEYQDVNHAQYMMIRMLAAMHKNLCVVGDDDQSIYAFRGADVSIILQFEKDFREARIVKLEQNYRSTQAILEAANAVVRNNPHRRDKVMWTTNNGGRLPALAELTDARAEARFAALTVRDMVSRGRDYGDFAVLYRANAQSRVFEDAMRYNAVPYELVGGTRFWDRKVVKDLVAYLRVVSNPHDDVSVRRIINVPKRGVGDVALTRLAEAAESLQCGMGALLGMLDPQGSFTVEAQDALTRAGGLQPKVARAVLDLGVLLGEVRAQAQGGASVRSLLEHIIRRVEYKTFVAPDQSPESQANGENVNELLNSADEFERLALETEEEPSLENFLAQGALASDLDTMETEGGKVTLMTLHGAKGLEFPVVFLAGLEEYTFPHSRVIDNPKELEEERRLCYVGMTRAREMLYLTRAMSRATFSDAQPQERPPSRFLSEIPGEGMEILELDHSRYSDGRSSFGRGGPGSYGGARSGFGGRSGYGDDSSYGQRSGSSYGARRDSGGYDSWSSPSSGANYTGGGKSSSGWRESTPSSPSSRPAPAAGRSTPSYPPRPASTPARGSTSPTGSSRVMTYRGNAARSIGTSSSGAGSAPATPRTPSSPFSPGQKVRHKVFGEGEVLKVDGRTVTVTFPGCGEKTMVESFLSPVPPAL